MLALGADVGCGSLYCVLFVFSCRLCCCSCPCSYDSLLCAPVDCNGQRAHKLSTKDRTHDRSSTSGSGQHELGTHSRGIGATPHVPPSRVQQTNTEPSSTPPHPCSAHNQRCVCDCVRGLDRLRFCPFCLFRPSTPALRCLGFITGAGRSPRRLGSSCMCAAPVPVAPAADTVPLCLWLWQRARCVVCWLDACAVAWLGDCRLWFV